MAVAHDFASESHTGTTGSTSEASFTWSHNPVGVPKGVLVFVWTQANADYITSVTYDGTALTQISEAADTAGEPGRCTAFFLGSSVPTTDPANVVVTRTNNATLMYAVCITVTADGNTETTTPVLIQENATLAEQAIDDESLTGGNSVRYAAVHYGGNAVPAAGANSTVLHGLDPGATQTFNVVRETTAGTGSRSVGFADASDDAAAIHLAIRETKRVSTPGVGSMLAQGLAAVVLVATTITPGVGSLAFSGQTPAFGTGLQMRGYAPTVAEGGGDPNITITPGVGSLTLTGAAPTVATTDHRLADPGVGSLTLTGAAPGTLVQETVTPAAGALALGGLASSLTETAHVVVTPPVGSAVWTGLAATLTTSDFVTQTPAAGALVLTGAVATVTATDHRTLTPDVGGLVLTGAVPSVTSEENSTLTPGAGTLVLTGAASTVSETNHHAITPTVGGLTVNGETPTLLASVSSTPTSGAVTLTGSAPTLSVSGDATLTPDVGRLVFGVEPSPTITAPVGSLTLTGAAPTVDSAITTTITPPAGSLTLTGAASGLGTTIRPPVAVLKCQPWAQISWSANTDPDLDGYKVYHGVAPSTYTESVDVGNVLTYVWNNLPYGNNYFAVTAYDTSANESAHSSEVSTVISGTGFAPNVSQTGPSTLTPGVGTLTLTGAAPTVTATDHQARTPGVVGLTLTGAASTITASDSGTVTPGVGGLTLTSDAPTVSATNHQALTPGVVGLTLTGSAPTVSATDHQSRTPGVGSLTFTGEVPTVEALGDAVRIPSPDSLTLTGFAPLVVSFVPLRPIAPIMSARRRNRRRHLWWLPFIMSWLQ